MAPEPRQLEASFKQIRNFLLSDLGRLAMLDPGVNYAATLVLMSGCELLGRLRYGSEGSGHRFFEDYMLPVEWRPVGKDLFDALRNGLAHSYDTKAIVAVGKHDVQIVISWRKRRHLSLDQDGHRLFVNVQSLIADVRVALDRYWAELHADPALRDRYCQWLKKDRRVNVIHEKTRIAWRQLLQSEAKRAG